MMITAPKLRRIRDSFIIELLVTRVGIVLVFVYDMFETSVNEYFPKKEMVVMIKT